MTEKVLIFLDDAELLPELSGSPGVLVVSLDREAASQLSRRPGLRVRDIVEYSETSFATYDELYENVKGAIRERVGAQGRDGGTAACSSKPCGTTSCSSSRPSTTPRP